MHDLLDPGTRVFWISSDGTRHTGEVVNNVAGGCVIREDGEMFSKLLPRGHCTEDRHAKKK